MWRISGFQMILAVVLDCLLGDPRGWPHIARIAGWFSAFYERLLAALLGRNIFAGVIFWVFVTGSMLAIYAAAWRACAVLGPAAVWILKVLVVYQAIAAADLVRHVRAIITPLAGGDLAAARHNLSRIVGRDTGNLDESGISRAAIESVAESTTDAVVAPLFWSLVAGAPGALIYRTANTLDSLAGHRNQAYEKFGKASARIDDALNWAPARICAAAFCIVNAAARWETIRREAVGHASPNAGWSEAGMAYSLGVRLGGEIFTAANAFRVPVFNATAREASPPDIAASLAWMRRASGVCAGAFVMLLFIVRHRLFR